LKKRKDNEVAVTEERLKYLEQLESEVKLSEMKYELPHLYLHKYYPWQDEYFKETNSQCWLTCANQIGKSSAQIIKCIMLATNKKLWSKYFKIRTPSTFWYFYPKKGTCTVEFKEKWKKTYLPKGTMKNDPVYGWKEDIRQKDINCIEFNSGITVYFMSYEMKDIQSVTVDAMFCDEEIPEDMYAEIKARLFATRGPFSCVFTATKGQDWTKRIIEGTGENRVFPHSWRRQISMYDCQYYTDGTPTKFTDEYINWAKSECPTDLEIQRRIYGKFVILGGLVYTEYKMSVHFLKSHPLPSNWSVYAGVDMGSGGENNHPAAIAFVAVNPERTKARIFKTWRGDYITTTATDILDKYLEMSKDMNVVRAVYDYAGQGQDFKAVANSRGIPVVPADKRHRDEGIDLMNVLFKNNMLAVYDVYDGTKLNDELTALKHETPKTKAKDDLIDAAKYIIREIPFDYSILNLPEPKREHVHKGISEREKAKLRGQGIDIDDGFTDDCEAEDILLSELDELNQYHDIDEDF